MTASEVHTPADIGSQGPIRSIDIFGQHCDRADAWLAKGFGDRLTDAERLSIRRVLFDRAFQAKSEMTRERTS